MSRNRAESLAGAALAIAGAATAAAQGSSLVTVAAAAVMGGAVGAGRRHPRVAWLLGAGALLAMAPDERSVAVPFFLVPILAFCAGRWDGRWSGLVGVAALIGASEIGVWITHDSGVPAFLIPAAAWAAARALAEREQVAAQLAERVRELEQEREAHARLSVRYERARIASELHDIVAHAISVMVVQATAGQRLAARDPEATAETFEAIAGAAHQAEEDIGRLVALLSDESAIGPAPDLALVEELVARASGSGLDVTLRLEGERQGLPAAVVETAYRVVQEGLTNALRYAAGAAVSVLIRGDRSALQVEVANASATGDATLAGAGTGTGLQGLRERVDACGGTLDAGPTPEGGWRLTARLPRRTPASVSRFVPLLALCLCLPLAVTCPAMARGGRVYGPKVISRDTPLPESCDGLRQDTDTTIAADPHQQRHLVATWSVDGNKSNVTATSRNAGRTWRISTIPGISRCTGGSSDQVVDPWVSIGRRGAAYFASLPLSESGFLVNRSSNGGTNWSAPATADPAAGLTDDLPSIVADPRRRGRGYLTWSRFTFNGSEMTGGDARFSRTVDGARTFSTPVVIHSPPAGQLVLESRLMRLSDGTLLDVFGDEQAQPVTAPLETFATRSRNGGRTWSRPVRIATVPHDAIVDPDSGAPRYVACCLFGVAAGRHGRAYLAYTRVAGPRSGRVVLVGSRDGGRRWGHPRTVARVSAQVLEPAVAVAGDGTVGVTWYDFRNDRAGDAALITDYWFAYSRDGGRHWHRRHLGGPFDLRSSSRAGRPLGVYEGLAGLPHGFATTFIQASPQARFGTEDVFFARVTLPSRPRR